MYSRKSVSSWSGSLSSSSSSFVSRHKRRLNRGAARKHEAWMDKTPGETINARERFVHAVKMVVILSRVSSFALDRKVEKSPSRQNMTFTEIAEEFQSENMKSLGLSFDPREFKARKELDISGEVRKILSSPSESRTTDQIQTAVFGLQSMTSFAEYPLHMQEKLVKVAWYESVPPKRVIIRQGHYAENFYFVISGSVIVTILENSASTGESYLRTAAVLRKGSSFGELALLHHSRRTATVSSQGPVQLLAIGREDFFDIFMRGQGPGKEPQHIAFIRQLPFMKFWPIDKLIEKPEMCLFHFFKRGQVVVQDSNNSDWIYVVKSGSCQVLRQLSATKPKLHVSMNRQGGNPGFGFHYLPSRSYTDTRITTQRRKRNKITATKAMESLPISDADDNKLRVSLDLSTGQSSARLRRAKTEVNMTSLVGLKDDHTSRVAFPNIEDIQRRTIFSRPSYSRSRYREIRKLNSPANQLNVNETFTAVDIKDDECVDVYDVTARDPQVFVQVESLQHRDVFGLSTLNIDLGIDHQQCSVSLVSRGAELIMIRKECFVRFTTAKVRRNLMTLIRAYPSKRTLQNNLQDHTNWVRYKAETMGNILADKVLAKE
ncbi:uncharacterized protein [Apostichopus japonicus]|uniref:uncharacterized protein isoform X3 n=1 Tax=Stichopus japonicus TaxID=307972 RepID=UPI003AB287A7